MRFATFTMSDDPRERVGVRMPDDTSLIDIAQVSEDADRPRWGDIVSLIAAAADGLPTWLRSLASDSSARALPLAEVRLLGPILRPRKNIFCVGLNYREHIAEGEFAGEAGASHPGFPEFFAKPPSGGSSATQVLLRYRNHEWPGAVRSVTWDAERSRKRPEHRPIQSREWSGCYE